MTDHLKPLEELTQKWKNTKNDNEAFHCFQACVLILKKHYDLSLNETKTAYKDENAIDQTQQELQAIVDLIVKKVIDPPNTKEINCLNGAFGVELSRYQTFIYREAQKNRVKKSNKEHSIEDELQSISMVDDVEEDIGEEEEEEEEEEEDKDEEDEGDDSDN